jgi:hypothetical protein
MVSTNTIPGDSDRMDGTTKRHQPLRHESCKHIGMPCSGALIMLRPCSASILSCVNILAELQREWASDATKLTWIILQSLEVLSQHLVSWDATKLKWFILHGTLQHQHDQEASQTDSKNALPSSIGIFLLTCQPHLIHLQGLPSSSLK